ncbi:hypothetical protein E4J89_04260 [Arthrobacter sp. CAU 1506]|uniref:hypothetical protein n=1 Tax=Arthrobacter sp. CAU 1506 TaxID=2560052 RepID=UPI0010AC528E|nr:hypothetical protein [Arthrobacter sp. CAU 1506]TJY71467.1 hypothetical protein E4J89_04260 [Arthrobacter sp. CAU 1506]
MMRSSAKWRARLLIAGVFLGLLASMGVAAPAGASSVAATSSQSQADRGDRGDANLSLRIFHNGDYRVRGADYDARRVHVWVVNVSRDRVVHESYARTHHGHFTVRDDGLRCDRTYKAVTFSRKDGWVSSNKVRFHCDRD